MGILSKKHISKLQAMPIQELRVILENELQRQGYLTYLTNLTDNDLTLKVIQYRKDPTIISLVRHRNRPFEVEIEVDYTTLPIYDLVKKRKKTSSRRQDNTFMMYRWLWIGLFLFSFIIIMLNYLANIVLFLIVLITPGWTSEQRIFGILAVTFMLFIWWQVGRPRYHKYKNQKREILDQHILQNVVAIIENIEYHEKDTSLIHCWSCFDKIDRTENFCPNCGKEQN